MMETVNACRLVWFRRGNAVKIAFCLATLLASLIVLILWHTADNLHPRSAHPGPPVISDQRTSAGANWRALAGGDQSLDVHATRSDSPEQRELRKEAVLLRQLNLTGAAARLGRPARANFSDAAGRGRRRYLSRAHIRRVLERRTLDARATRPEEDSSCRLPDLSPFDESIKGLLRPAGTLDCEGTMRTDVKDGRLVLLKSAVGEFRGGHCFASSVRRAGRASTGIKLSTPVRLRVDETRNRLPGGDVLLTTSALTDDFTAVACLDARSQLSEAELKRAFDSGQTLAAFRRDHPRLFDVHARVVPRPGALRRSEGEARRPSPPPSDAGLGLNVVVLVLASASRMAFLRRLPSTQEALRDLDSRPMEGYSAVAGDDSAGATPVLTGRTRPGEPLAADRRRHAGSAPAIWAEFAGRGYATLLALDSGSGVDAELGGVGLQPPEHRLEHLWMTFAQRTRNHCLGPTPVHNVVLDYLKDFMVKYKDRPHFAFSLLSDLTHRDASNLELMDSDLTWFLSHSLSMGLLNNTALFLLGGPGSPRSPLSGTLQGKLEERLPLMYVTLPRWFSERHPDLARNLARNRKRLVTPFDVHETLRDVLQHEPTSERGNRRGLSLFGEIPRKRTCDDAHIPPHLCTCLTWEPVNLQKTAQVGGALVRNINAMTETDRNECAELSLSLVLYADRLVPDPKVLRHVNTDGPTTRPASFSTRPGVLSTELPTLYRVAVVTTPGDALFQGTVKVLAPTKGPYLAYQFTNEVGRMGGPSGNWKGSCLGTLSPSVKPLCHCKKA